jgi:hypothetical protein
MALGMTQRTTRAIIPFSIGGLLAASRRRACKFFSASRRRIQGFEKNWIDPP